MNSLSLPRLPLVFLASLFILASCGGSDDTATSIPTATVAVETEAPAESTTTTTSADSTTTTVDTRTPEEIIIDDLDLMMYRLGVRELEVTANCVIERLESENIELQGDGTAELIALSGCDESVISEWLPTTNPALPQETWACTVESIGDWIGDLSIPDAEAFFSAGSPPTEFIELTADRCDASAEDLTAAFS